MPGLLDLLAMMPDPNKVAAGMGQMGPVPKALPSAWQKMKNRLMPQQQGMEGLLSDEDQSQAQGSGLLGVAQSLLESSGPTDAAHRVGFMQSIGRGLGAGKQAYQEGIQGAAGLRANQQQYQAGKLGLEGKQLELDTAKGLATGRKAIIDKYPMPKGDMNAMSTWIDQVLPHFIEINDNETVGKLSEIRKSLDEKFHNPQEIDTGGSVQLRDPRTGKIVYEVPKTPVPKDPNAGAEARASLAGQRSFFREARLADAYESVTKDSREAHQFVSQTMQNVPLAKAGNGAAQVELLYGFIKALDPSSVVREGEVALARTATPLWDWAKANVSKVENKSTIVPPEMVEKIADLMRKRLKGYETYMGNKRKYYVKRAERAHIPDPDSAFDVVPSWSDSGSGSGTGNNPLMR